MRCSTLRPTRSNHRWWMNRRSRSRRVEVEPPLVDDPPVEEPPVDEPPVDDPPVEVDPPLVDEVDEMLMMMSPNSTTRCCSCRSTCALLLPPELVEVDVELELPPDAAARAA